MVLRVTDDASRAADHGSVEALLVKPGALPKPGFQAYLSHEEPKDGWVLRLPAGMSYLAAGDIVRLQPRVGEIWTLYRRSSRSNAMLLTERCNSRCVMCSQPPNDDDDEHLFQTWMQAIRLMDPATASLGITGGEPTLLGDRLLAIIAECKRWLPATSLHLLSNGRMFTYMQLARAVAGVGHPELMIGIPLYSDVASGHDFVVQAEGAFDQTVRGIMNLKRSGVRVELRVVLHALTIGRLEQLAAFIARNLCVVDHVALMGLEHMGYVKMNMGAVWIDPADYQGQLRSAVRTLTRAGLAVSIYNHPLCVLDASLWPWARQSISDWKNEYLPVCEGCGVRSACGGLFSSGLSRPSRAIHPLPGVPEAVNVGCA